MPITTDATIDWYRRSTNARKAAASPGLARVSSFPRPRGLLSWMGS
ncbi:MAG: hypothetical protein IPP90_23715 [Gemmatimonadaceae bacterium]|nr:hypothetical protein [Gemmatimonadaceae bacterium]